MIPEGEVQHSSLSKGPGHEEEAKATPTLNEIQVQWGHSGASDEAMQSGVQQCQDHTRASIAKSDMM